MHRNQATLSASALLASALLAAPTLAQDVLGTIDIPYGGDATCLGDVDGDGLDDFAIGFASGIVGSFLPNYVDVYSGATQGLLVRIPGPTPDDAFGAVVTSTDLDGDGALDLVVSAPNAVTPAGRTGRVYAYSGAGASLLFTLDGTLVDGGFGSIIAVAGDVDADGTPDLIVGMPTAFLDGTEPASATVYSGTNGAMIHRIESPGNSAFGASVAGAGDVNADGSADFAIADPAQSRVFVYSGADAVLWNFYSDGFPSFGFGVSMTEIGDLDGDQVSDLLIGSYSGGYSSVRSGLSGNEIRRTSHGNGASVYGVARAGDVDGDAVPDFSVGGFQGDFVFIELFSGASGQLLFRVESDLFVAGLGPLAPVLGDLDGDGLDEVLVHTLASQSGPGEANIYGLTPANGEARCLGVANSSGARAPLEAFGSFTAAENDLTLVASNLPAGSVALMLASPGYGVAVQPGGANGNLCLAGGPIGRYVANVFSGPGSVFALSVDLTAVPAPAAPTFQTAVQPGDTWLWQAWYRDGGAPGATNFTDAVEITFD